ncbi:MAG: thioredoxin family protein [Phycisphaerales bacterium]|nr:thioredoxin family protein [Phycisphaerales bacterium]
MKMNRNKSVGGRVVWPLILFMVGAFPGQVRSDTKTKSVKVGHVTVQAFTDRAAIVPGETFHLAVSLKMDKKWHVYWRNPGDTGLPTEIDWSAPDGYQIGRTRFPVPEAKYSKVLKETSFIHEGTAIFLTPVKVSASAKVGGQATLKGEVRWLACKQNCIPGDAEVSFSLPVVSAGSQPEPANEKLFEEARDALPTPGESAERIKLSGSTDKKVVEPGDKFSATLNVEIASKHHMQSNKPLQDGLIPAYLFVETTDGFEIGKVAYPKAHIRKDKLLGKLSEYGGKVAFKIPIEVDEEADTSPRWVRGVLQYQICSDAGTCYQPQYVTWRIPVQMKGGPAPVMAAQATPAPVGADKKESPRAERSEAATASEQMGFLARSQQWFQDQGYWGVLLMAFIGGLILNLMPCVLPVISLKILSFVKQSNEDRGRVFVLGLAYCGGILVFFSFIALLYFKTNQEFGWGQLLQAPHVVLGLSAVVTAFALSLFGVFALFTPKVIDKLGEKAEGEGVFSAFSTGVLATLLGTACTAPFLSAAVGAASNFPAGQGAGIFLAVGVGMMFPFLVLSANPGWLKFLPKPGPWMGVFEALMGFLLLGTVIWLLYTVRGQLGDHGLLLTLIFLLAVSVAVWIKGKVQFGDPMGRKVALHTLGLVVVIVGWSVPFRLVTTVDELIAQQIERNELIALGEEVKDRPEGEPVRSAVVSIDWGKQKFPFKHYRRDRVQKLVKQGYAVFVDYTADWCVNCKVNLKSSIDKPEVRALMKEHNVIPFKADYTLPVPQIKEDLKRFGRAGVPMYLVFSPFEPNDPQILPELLTPGIVLDALKKAGPSKVRASNHAFPPPTPESEDEARMASKKSQNFIVP